MRSLLQTNGAANVYTGLHQALHELRHGGRDGSEADIGSTIGAEAFGVVGEAQAGLFDGFGGKTVEFAGG
jgi:hypothetical protein